jgi:putative transposase
VPGRTPRWAAFPARYLLLDGLWVSVRQSRHAKWQVILAAYGIAADGRRELLVYRQATVESTAAWSRLLTSLMARGLDPDRVARVVADGADGIAAAAAEAFPPRQGTPGPTPARC